MFNVYIQVINPEPLLKRQATWHKMTPNDVIVDHQVQNGVHNTHTVHDIHDKRVVEIVEEDNNLLVDQITSTV